MSRKNKLAKFAENKTFNHLFEPVFSEIPLSDFEMKGRWNAAFFGNSNSIVAEFGCGKGDYCIALSQLHTNKNYIGVDIKGARLWRGAKTSEQIQLQQVAFVRTRIEFTPYCFAKNELSEIWITFPDPQLRRKKRIKKRLTSARFLSYYQKMLVNNGIVHLKTDDDELFNYTRAIIELNGLPLVDLVLDVYSERPHDAVLGIKTFYENMWLAEGRTIKYLSFRLPDDCVILEPVSNESENNE